MSRYCGICWYFSNSAAHAAVESGGRMPVTGCHSGIESPDRVNRVMPPITTIAKIMAQQDISQMATGLGLGAAALPHIHRMQLALDIGAPEFEKAPQLGIIRRKIEVLPDEALEQGRVIRQAIDDLCSGEPVPVKLQLAGGHVSLVRSLSCTEV